MRKFTQAQQKELVKITKHLGSLVRQERTLQGRLQADMSEQLGVSLPTYRAMEAGKGTVSLGLLVGAMVVLGIGDQLSKITTLDQETRPKLSSEA